MQSQDYTIQIADLEFEEIGLTNERISSQNENVF